MKQTKEHKIGNGAFGCVFKAQYFGATVAAKTLFALQNPLLYGFDDESQMDQLLKEIGNEIQLLSRARHPNIVQFIGAAYNTKGYPIWILSEYMPGGSLAAHITNHPSGLPRILTLRAAQDIIQGLTYIHGLDWIHRDIKPANVLFDGQGNWKICDFGVARLVTNQATQTLVGTPQYVAPEVVSGKYGSAVDVWSFAVSLVEMVNGKIMSTNADQISRVDAQIAIAKYPDLSPVITGSLVIAPNGRLSAQAVLGLLQPILARATNS